MAADDKPKVLVLENEEAPEEVKPDPPPPLKDQILKYAGLAVVVGGLFSTVLCAGLGGSWVWKSATAPAEIPPGGGLALVPFAHQAEGAEHLAETLSSDLIAGLSGVQGLEVPPAKKLLALAGDARPLAEIGGELDVRYVVQGAVKSSGSNVVVDLAVVDAIQEGTVLTQKFTRPSTELYGLEDEILRAVVAATRLPTEGVRAARITDKQEAYEPFARGRRLCAGDDPAALAEGIAAYGAAVKADDAFVAAHRGLAECWARAAEKGGVAPKDAHPQAQASAKRALELQPSLGDDPAFQALNKQIGL